jgi:hypothetical protein
MPPKEINFPLTPYFLPFSKHKAPLAQFKGLQKQEYRNLALQTT